MLIQTLSAWSIKHDVAFKPLKSNAMCYIGAWASNKHVNKGTYIEADTKRPLMLLQLLERTIWNLNFQKLMKTARVVTPPCNSIREKHLQVLYAISSCQL